jgi:helicase
MRIEDLPLPPAFTKLLAELGYRELYPPQAEAVRRGVLDGKNMVLASPTASGKTLVAMMAMARKVLEQGCKAVYLTPLRALAYEKFSEFQVFERLVTSQGVTPRVGISTGDYDKPAENLGRFDIIVMTNEKFDSVLRRGASWLDRVRLFILDEIHLVGEGRRGPIVESILARVLSLHPPDSQVLALSATIANSEEFGRWVDAEVITTEWRPVPLREGVYEDGEIRFNDGTTARVASSGRGPIVDVAIDGLKGGGQSLVFADTRRRAVSLALRSGEVVERILSPEERAACRRLSGEVLDAAEETELSRLLADAVARGVAFHHAGLAAEHRRLVEDGFRDGVLKVLCSTPTLAAGVNLPARRVVIASPARYDTDYGGSATISVLEYRQMIGRAGRPRYDEYGEAVLVSSPSYSAEELRQKYIEGEVEPIESKLGSEDTMRIHTLALIVSLPGATLEELFRVLSHTLLRVQRGQGMVEALARRAIRYLGAEGLVKTRGRRLVATEFGSKVSTLYIDPLTGVMFRDAILSHRDAEVRPVGLLHLIAGAPDFEPKLSLRSRDWEEAAHFVEEHAGEFLAPPPQARDYVAYEEFMEPMRRVMTLYHWLEEEGEDQILEKMGVEPGDLHRMVESAEWLAHSLAELAQLLGAGRVALQARTLEARLAHGVKEELLPLVSLEGIGRVRARILYTAGLRTPADISRASVERLALLPKIGPTLARRLKEQLSRAG